jgi:hypothetical protein
MADEIVDLLAQLQRSVNAAQAARRQSWIDKHGDVWRYGDDGLMHTPETRPFPREYVERKWGPLRLIADPATAPTPPEPLPDDEETTHG